MNTYILKAEGNSRMALFVFSIFLIGFGMAAAIYGLSGGTLIETFSGLPIQDAESASGVVAGFLMFPVIAFWLYACLFCWAFSFVLSKKLNKGQRNRLSAVFFMIYTTVANIIAPFAAVYVNDLIFWAVNLVLYVLLLKEFEKTIIKNL